MKKFRLLMVTLLMAVALVTNAQIAGYYVFSNQSGTYTPITGGSLLSTVPFDDDLWITQPIGFSFVFNGTTVTTLTVSANGYLIIGGTSSLGYTPISSTAAATGCISALGRDLQGTVATAGVRIQTIGIAPNRTLVVQYKDMQRYGSSWTGENFNFQIRLNETTNIIEIIYGSSTILTNADPYYDPQVGLRGTTNASFKNRTTTANWAATIAGAGNADACKLSGSIKPADGQIFRFSPASCLPPTAPLASNFTQNTVDLNWTSTATEWQIEYGLAGFAPGNGTRTGTTVKPYTLTGLAGGTNYTYYVRNICTPGDTSDWSSGVNFATVCDTVNVFPYTQGFESTVYPPVCWTSAKIGGTGTPGTFDRVTAGTYPTATPHNGTAMIRYLCSGSLSGYYPAGTNGIMATKALNLPNNNYAVSFWMYRDNGLPNNKDSVLIYINSNPNLTGATKLAKFHRCTTLSPIESSNGWYRYFVNLGPGSAGNGKYVIINAWSGNGANIYIDDITVDLAPTCYPPTALGVGFVNLHQANLTWTSSAAQWQVEYGAPNFVQGTGTKVIANANPFTLTGLAAATGYSYYVRAICAAGDTSLWNGPVSFATDCDSIRNFPYTESFDGTTFPPICWFTSGSNPWDRQTAGTLPACLPHSGAGMARFNSASYSTGNTGYLATKAIVLPTDNYMVDFWMYRNSNSTSPDSLKVYLNWSPAPNGGTLLGKIPRYTSGTSGWYNIKLYFPAGSAGNGKYLVFEGKSGWGNNIFIDDVTLRKQPTCIEPVSASVSNILSSSADIDWVPYTSAPDWEIEWDTLGFTPGTGIKEYATAYPYTLNGLSPQTSYSFYIRAICSEGDTSARFGPVTFTTPCVSITTFPISESFDGTLFAPACWGNNKTAGSGSLWQRSTAGTSPTCAPHTGLGMAYFNSYSYSGTKVELVTPAFDLPTDLYMVTFWMYRDNGYSSNRDSVAVYFNNAPNTTGATKLIRVNRSKGFAPIETGADGWYKYKAYFPAGSAGTGKYVIFEGTSLAGNNIYIDDVVIEPMPTCPEPSNLKDTVLSGTKVKIDWTPFGTETQWRVEYGAPGFVQGTGMSFLTNHHPDTITGLNPASNYQFYVKAICSATDSSVSLGPLGFTTGCDTIRNLPYTNGFEIPTGVPNCWLTTNLIGTTLWSGATSLTGVPSPHSGSYFMGRYYSPSANSLLVTPIFKINSISTNPQVKVWVYRTTTGTNNINDSITFYCNTKPNLTGAQKLGMVHAKFNLTPVVAAAGWYQYTYNLPAAYNDSSFYVVTLGSTNHGTSSTGLGIDDFILQERPLCDSPINLVSSNVTSDSATISWTSGGTETQWQVEYGPTGFAHGAGTNVIVNTLPTVILTGLNSATTYDFYIRAICGVGDTSAWSNSSNFTTLCTAVTAFPYLEGFEGTTFPPICWSTFQVVGPGTGLWIGVTSGSYPTCAPHTGSKMTEFNSFSYSTGTKGALVTRALNLPTNYYQVTFWMYRDDGYTGNHDSVTVYFNNAPNVTGATLIGGIPRYLGFAPTEAANGWYEYSFNFPAVSAGNNKYVIFEGYSRYGNNMFIDDVLIDVQPTCAKPTLLTVNSYTANSATVSWTPGSGATLFNLEYGPTGYTPGTGTAIDNVTNPYTITGLTEVTGYDFYVQDSCTASDVSLWAGPKGFTTDSACSKPTNIHITALTPISATIGWNGNASIFNVEYGPAGFTPGSGTIVHNVTVNPYTINGLTANTNYDFYVQDSCGASAVSFWAGAFNFSTACIANSVFPFHEGFDTIVFAPPCWTYTLLSGSYGWLRSTAGLYPTCSPHSGVGMAEYNSFSISTGGRALLVSKPQNLPNDNYQVRFWMYRDNGYTTNPDRIEVRFNDSPDTAGSTLLGTINRTIGMAPVVAANGWYEYTFPFEAGSGGAGRYVIFEGLAAFGNNIFIDDVYIETQPSCPKPTQVHVDTTTTTTATLSWTTHNANKWNLEYGPAGHAFGTGIMIHNITQNPYILTGLTPATSYDFYVQDSCLANDVSTWAGPVGFNTKCNGVISNYPYNEGFESSYFPPDCWDTLITNVSATWKSGAPGHNSSKCAYINYDYDTQDETLLSPTFDLTTNPEPVMDFWFNTSTSSPTLYDVYLKASTDDGATYPYLLWQKSTTNIYPSNTWTQRKVNLAPYDTCHKFKFKFEYTGNNGYAFSLDDVSIKIGNKLQITYPHDTVKMCTMTTTDTLKMTIKNVGLNPIASGQKIKTFFKINATAVVRDSITLTSTFNVGDSIKYKFPQTVDFSAPIAYFVGMLISYPDGIIWAGDTAQTWFKLTSFSFNPWTVDTIYTNGFPYTLHAGPGYVAYSWDGGPYSASESHIVSATGMQTVLVKQHYNCYGNDHVYVKDTSHAAIGEYTNDSRIGIYPNPTNGILNINLNGVNENPDLTILTLQGQVVYTEKLVANTTKQLDLTVYPKGVYFIKLSSDKVLKIERIVIQ
jgi:hypothetical protein